MERRKRADPFLRKPVATTRFHRKKSICSYLWFRFPSRLPEENQMRRENRAANTVYIIISLSTNNDYSIHSLMIPVLCILAFQTLILSYFLRFFFPLFYHYIFIPFLYFFLFLCFQFLCSKQALMNTNMK